MNAPPLLFVGAIGLSLWYIWYSRPKLKWRFIDGNKFEFDFKYKDFHQAAVVQNINNPAELDFNTGGYRFTVTVGGNGEIVVNVADPGGRVILTQGMTGYDNWSYQTF